MGQIYLITCLVTGKYYVGQTTWPLARRWSGHKLKAKTGSGHLQLAIRKYGAEKFVIEPLAEVSTDLLNALERLWVILLDAANPVVGMNLTFGGDGAGTWSPAQRAAIAVRMKGNKHGLGSTHTPEERLRIGLRSKNRKMPDSVRKAFDRTGKSSWCKGKKLPARQVEKMRQDYWLKRKNATQIKNMLRSQAANRKGIHMPLPVTRVCRVCVVAKPLNKDNFSPNNVNSLGPDQLNYKCKPCCAQLRRERYARKALCAKKN